MIFQEMEVLPAESIKEHKDWLRSIPLFWFGYQ